MNGQVEVLRLENVVRYFRNGAETIRAVDGVDLTVFRGEMVSIMGASGSGKSSLLYLIGALDRPQGGKVFFAGLEITAASEKTLQKLRLAGVGFVFQSFNLMPVLTALENVRLPMELRGVVVPGRAEELLAKVGLAGKEHRYPKELSGGENQRVAIARALANSPLLILADEPTGNLDSKSSQAVMQSLKELTQAEGVAVIVVTHNPQVAALADRHFQMRDGRLLEAAGLAPSPLPSTGEVLL